MGCGGKSNPTPPTVATPLRALLTAPAQNAVCTTGTVISTSQSSVAFSWNAAENTDSYDLILKNLLTSTSTTQNTTATQLTVTLARNTPYSWYVVSKSTKTNVTAQSDAWKFYNSGPGVVTYAPFPAEITAPLFGQNVTATSGKINLTWKGSSVTAGTIASYDVYFGTTSTPPLVYNAITNSFVNDVSVTSTTTYYWKVITKAVDGNTSDSGIFKFTVK
jgi:hypothetical protein